MDYQRSGWFRPTCGVNRTQTVHPQQPNVRTMPAPQECSPNYPHIEPTSLAIVYAPVQAFVKIYDPQKALVRGTLFAELDRPFTGKC